MGSEPREEEEEVDHGRVPLIEEDEEHMCDSPAGFSPLPIRKAALGASRKGHRGPGSLLLCIMPQSPRKLQKMTNTTALARRAPK
ncbi:unnamed protein product, partial [Mesorhabditis spiculigera]